MHQVCPKIFGLRGPANRPGMCPPEEFLTNFQENGVTDVIRLRDGEAVLYDAEVYTSHGLQVHDIVFEECSLPLNGHVTSFLDVVDQSVGKVAVHCHSGLGGTGTMIAMWIMKNMGWTGRETMGWLRVVRPGSVLGGQQHYLDAMTTVRWHGNVLGGGFSKEVRRMTGSCYVSCGFWLPAGRL